MRTLLLLTLTALISGCGSGDTLVVITVRATPPLLDVGVLHVTAVAGGRTADFDVPAHGVTTLPPERTLGVTVPASLSGTFSAHVRARSAAGSVVSEGDCQTQLSPGHRVDCLVQLGAGGADGGTDGGSAGDLPARLIAPLSTATVTSRRPTLRWQLPAGSSNPVVEVCANRAMTTGCLTVAADASGLKGVPSSNLPVGMLFWRVRTGTGPTATSATWQLNSPAITLPRDTSSGNLLDVDGDGFADVAVSAYNDDTTTGRGGPVSNVYLFRGGATGIGPSALTHWLMNNVTDGFGSTLAGVGDVNGDGYADFAIGAYLTSSGAGRVFVYYGGPNGLGASPAPVTLMPSVTLQPPGSDVDGNFGTSIAGVGDLDGDGYADLAIGGPTLTIGGNTNSGRVYLFYGSANGPGGAARTNTLNGRNGPASYFGNAVSSAGDVNGDGYADLAIASWAYAQTNAKGFAYLYLGGAAGIADNASPTVNLIGNDGGGQFGSSLAFGDFNCDGLSDLVIGARMGLNAGVITGNAVVFRGDATKGLNVMDVNLATYGDGAVFYGASNGSSFGWSVAGAGDVDRDGCGDLVIGAPGEAGDVGRVYVYRGGSSFAWNTTPIVLNSPSTNLLRFGESVAGGGDLTGTGYAAVLAGAPNPTNNMTGASLIPYDNYLYIFLGSTAGTSAALTNSWQSQLSPTSPTLRSAMGHAVY